MSTYARPHLSFAEQLEALKGRGLVVTDDAAALSYLRRLGYYRLSAYWYAFRRSSLVAAGGRVVRRIHDDFQDGAAFESAVDLYVFDKKLRLLTLDAIERIEVALRVDIAYNLGKKNTFAHYDPSQLHGHFSKKVQQGSGLTKHESWLRKLDDITDRSKEEFVKHYKAKYGLPLPIWVSIEVWDFGLLSHFYAGMKADDQLEMCTRFGVPRPELMVSWLRSINYVRNIVAHHGRLFNRNMIDYPEMPAVGEIAQFDPVLAEINRYRPYATLCIIAFLMDQICPQSQWRSRVRELLSAFPAVQRVPMDVTALGCHPGWAGESFWA